MTRKPKIGKIKSALLNWLGVPIGLMDEGFWHNFSSSEAGQTINDQTVMKLSAVWSCVRLISETISTLPLSVYRRTADGREKAIEHPLYPIIHGEPTDGTTAAVFWESLIASMLLRGNGFSEKLAIGDRIAGLKFLAPARLTSTRTVNGGREFRYTEKNGQQRTIPESSVFRIPGFTTDGDWGMSAIEYGSLVFGSGLAAQSAAASTFEKGLMPTVAFKMERILSPQQRDDFRKSVEAISGALNAGKSPVLEGGIQPETIGIKPSDAQLLESRSFSVEEICRWFRVPPWMVGHTEKSTSWGTGIEQQMIGFLTFTLRPWLVRIEQAINYHLLTAVDRHRGFYAEFSVEGLLRADSRTRAEFYSKMVGNGIYTRDDARRKENLSAKGGNADVLTVQSAMVPLDMIGQFKSGPEIKENQADEGTK